MKTIYSIVSKSYRLCFDLSQLDMANQLNVSVDTVKSWECGRRSMSYNVLLDLHRIVRSYYILDDRPPDYDTRIFFIKHTDLMSKIDYAIKFSSGHFS